MQGSLLGSYDSRVVWANHIGITNNFPFFNCSSSPDEIGRPDLPSITRCIGEYNLELSRNPLSSSASTTVSDNRPRVVKSMSNYLAQPVLPSMIRSADAAANSESFRSWALPDSVSTSRNASPTSNTNSDYSGNTSPLTNSDLQDCLNRCVLKLLFLTSFWSCQVKSNLNNTLPYFIPTISYLFYFYIHIIHIIPFKLGFPIVN